MSLSGVIAEMKKSGFTCLVVGKKVMGIRAKLFDEPTRKFKYFDFSVSNLDSENKKYIQDNLSGMQKEELIDTGDMWLTQSEISGGVVVDEIENAGDINHLVAQIIKIKTIL